MEAAAAAQPVDADVAVSGLVAPVASEDSLLGNVVALVREHLGMDLAWISEFRDGDQVIVEAVGDTASFGVSPGWRGSLEGSYCRRVADGELPQAIPDASQDPTARAMPVTAELGIGSYVGAPLRDGTGRLQGMLCAMSHAPSPALDERDARFLSLFSALVAEELAARNRQAAELDAIRARVDAVLGGRRFAMVFQPIVRLRTLGVVGAEALARFADGPPNPAAWLAEAELVDRRVDVELALVAAGLRALGVLPAPAYVSVNVSPATAVDPRLPAVVASGDASRVVVEITEHDRIADYEVLKDAVAVLRALGARVAVDDAGSGFAGLTHLVRLVPDVVKLDIAITSGIDDDPARVAAARSLVDFAASTGATLIAEGIETDGELGRLMRLGFHGGQGYLLGRPGPLPLPPVTVRAPQRVFETAVAHVADRLALHAAASQGADELIEPLLDRVIELTELESSYVTFLHRDDMTLEHRHVRNASDLEVPAGLTIPWPDSLCARCRQRGITWTADVRGDLDDPPIAAALGVEAFLSLPLVDAHGVTIGSICAVGRAPRYIDDVALAELREIADAIARHPAVADAAPRRTRAAS